MLQMTASRCCICYKPLTDAESVEHGIGPVCSHKYYAPDQIPTQEQVQTALGLLAVSNLPDGVIDAFIKEVNNDHLNARKGCNVLIYWCSANYENRTEVFKCTSIMRALGYTELADKLEIDRSVASIKDNGDHFVAFTQMKGGFERDMTRIPDVKKLDGQKKGSKQGWFIPKSQEAYFLTVLGFYYPNQLACGSKGIFTIPRKSYGNLINFRRPPRPVQQNLPNPTSPSVTGKVSITVTPDAVEIYAPYNDNFKNELKKQIPYIDRTWTGTCWKVRANYVTVVRQLIQTHFQVTV
jgi:hypothetical protein